MNLRDIKKDIEYLVGQFVDDCIAFLTANPQKEEEKIASLLEEATDLYNALKDKVYAKADNKKAHFDGIRKELVEKVDALYEKLSQTVVTSKK